ASPGEKRVVAGPPPLPVPGVPRTRPRQRNHQPGDRPAHPGLSRPATILSYTTNCDLTTSRSGFAERLTRQRIEANPSRTAGAATVDGRADTVACTRLGLCYCSSVGDSAAGQSMKGLGAAFCSGLDGRAMSREPP